jgi:hypothetical protein
MSSPNGETGGVAPPARQQQSGLTLSGGERSNAPEGWWHMP